MIQKWYKQINIGKLKNSISITLMLPESLKKVDWHVLTVNLTIFSEKINYLFCLLDVHKLFWFSVSKKKKTVSNLRYWHFFKQINTRFVGLSKLTLKNVYKTKNRKKVW